MAQDVLYTAIITIINHIVRIFNAKVIQNIENTLNRLKQCKINKSGTVS